LALLGFAGQRWRRTVRARAITRQETERERREGMAEGCAEHRQSSFGREYWLRRCEGFRVEGPGGRLGHVKGIRLGSSADPEALEVGAGLLGRRRLLIAVSEIAEIVPEEERFLTLRGHPRLLATESVEED
jgi:hypothetical protein